MCPLVNPLKIHPKKI